jgi:uncharacterized repeat protein (TIGR04052 family)
MNCSSPRTALSLLSLAFTLTACSDDDTPRSACDFISEACHHESNAAAARCHDVGHENNLAACEAMLPSCLSACTLRDAGTDAGDPLLDGGRDAGSDAGTGEVEIRFEARVGAEPFSCGDTYALGTPAMEAAPVDLRFYVQQVRLIANDGTEVPLVLEDNDFQRMGVALVDFEDGAGGCNQGDAETNAVIRGTVPPGSYRGLAFRLGIPMELNHRDLTSLPAPLNRTSLFWGWRFGHIFFAATTRATVEVPFVPDGGTPDGGIDGGTMSVQVEHFTHVGATDCDGDPEMGIPVTSCRRPNDPEVVLAEFDAAADVVVVDFAEVKRDVDVREPPGCHSFSDACSFPFDALGLNWATGSYTPTTQRVFRGE